MKKEIKASLESTLAHWLERVPPSPQLPFGGRLHKRLAERMTIAAAAVFDSSWETMDAAEASIQANFKSAIGTNIPELQSLVEGNR